MTVVNNRTRIVFMGTPDFAVPSLRVLMEEDYCQVVAVVTQPDRPKGRKRILTPSPVKEEALRHGIPLLQPERMRREEAVRQLAEYAPDLIVTAAYGQLLPKAVLELPQSGCINVHASLLPKYRGGAPIHHAVMAGEQETGVTIMYMEEGLDTGDMIAKTVVAIRDEDDTGSLFDKLAVEGAELLRRTLPGLLTGTVAAEPQNHQEAVIAPNIRREDEIIDWNRPARVVFNHIRGLSPWPVAYTTWNGSRFKVWAARLPAAAAEEPSADAIDGSDVQSLAEPAELAAGSFPEAGMVLAVTDDGIQVAAAAGGSIWLTKVQPSGKKAMTVSEFRKGTHMKPGTLLGG